MKKYIFSSMIALALAGFTACSEDDVKYDGPGEWNATENYANVYFDESSYSESIDPADPTEYSIMLYRHVKHEYTFAKDSLGNDSITNDTIVTPLPKLTVKPTIVENTDNVFTVSDAEFAEGDTVAVITAKFPEAGIGNPYTLKITIEGDEYVSDYSAGVQFTYTVTREKWVLMEGKGTYYDYVIQEMWLEGDPTPYPVEIYQKESDPNSFRIMNPYKDMVSGDDCTAPQSDYMELRILQPGDKVPSATSSNLVTVSQKGLVFYDDTYTGYTHYNYGAPVYLVHPVWFSSTHNEENWSYNKVLAWQEDGKTPGKVQIAAFYYMDGVGGFNYSQNDDLVLITFPGYKELYEANIDEDFTWEKIYEGKFVSEQLGTTTDATLMKGTCITTTDGCDSVFAANYGTAYKVVAPYAEGSDLIFCAKGKKIMLAPGYEDPQPIGIKAVGKDVYATINTDESSFASDGDIITLNITFTDEEEEIEFGTASEQLLNLTYTEIGTGVYNYNVEPLSQGGSSYYTGSEEATLFQCDQDPSQYYLTPWAKSEEGFIFTVQADKTIKFYQSTGENYVEEGEDYGTVYFMDIEEYNPNYAEYLGKYDGNKTFEFVGSYYIPGVGGFGLIAETFVLDGEEAADGARTLHSKDLRLNKTYRAPSRFKAKKVNKTQRNGQKNWKSAIRPSMELLTK